MRRFFAALMLILFSLILLTPTATASSSDDYHFGWSRPVRLGTSDTSSGLVKIVETSSGKLAMIVVKQSGNSKSIELLTVDLANLQTRQTPLLTIAESDSARDFFLTESEPGIFHATWQVGRDKLMYASFDEQGKILVDPDLLDTSGVVKNARLIWNGNRLVLLWSELLGSKFRIHAKEFSPGSFPDSPTLTLVDTYSHNSLESVQIAMGELVMLFSFPDAILEEQTHFIQRFDPFTLAPKASEEQVYKRGFSLSLDAYHRATMTVDNNRVLLQIPDRSRSASLLWIGALEQDGMVNTVKTLQGWEYWTGSLAVDPRGDLYGTWMQRYSRSNNEVTIGDLSAGSSVRLTYHTRVKALPELVIDAEGYKYVVYHDVGRRDFTLYLSTDRFPDNPTIWHWLGLDSDHLLGSLAYSLAEIMMYAIYQSSVSIFAFGLAFVAILVLRMTGFSASRSLRGFRLEMLLVITICFLLRPIFIYVPGTVAPAYELFAFVLATASTFFILTFGIKVYADEPLSLLLTGFSWVLFFQIIIMIPQVQTLVR
jgi:hypothetical protein